MTAKPLSAEEKLYRKAMSGPLEAEEKLRLRVAMFEADESSGWEAEYDDVAGVLSQLDAARAETAAVVRERDALLTDRDLWKEQHDALRALAADLVEGLDALLDAGNPSASYCEECDSHAPIRADGEGLAGPLTHEPQCPVGTARALLTRAALAGDRHD